MSETIDETIDKAIEAIKQHVAKLVISQEPVNTDEILRIQGGFWALNNLKNILSNQKKKEEKKNTKRPKYKRGDKVFCKREFESGTVKYATWDSQFGEWGYKCYIGDNPDHTRGWMESWIIPLDEVDALD